MDTLGPITLVMLVLFLIWLSETGRLSALNAVVAQAKADTGSSPTFQSGHSGMPGGSAGGGGGSTGGGSF